MNEDLDRQLMEDLSGESQRAHPISLNQPSISIPEPSILQGESSQHNDQLQFRFDNIQYLIKQQQKVLLTQSSSSSVQEHGQEHPLGDVSPLVVGRRPSMAGVSISFKSIERGGEKAQTSVSSVGTAPIKEQDALAEEVDESAMPPQAQQNALIELIEDNALKSEVCPLW